MKLSNIWPLVRQAVSAWVDDYAPSMGAAIAYYTMFSIAPLLLIAISVAGLVFGRDAASAEVLSQLRGLMGDAGAMAVQSLLESASQPAKSLAATVIGTGALLVGATSVFGELQDSLDRIWRAPARDKTSGIWHLVRSRLLSFGMILGIGFLLMTSLVLSAALAAFSAWTDERLAAWHVLASVLNFVVSYALVAVMFALIYKIMPRVRIAWHDVWFGAAVTALLFNAGKFLIGLYIGTSGVTSTFGAAGSLAVLLLWVYYSAQIFLLGAEFTWAYAHSLGSCRVAPEPAPPVAAPQRDEPIGRAGPDASGERTSTPAQASPHRAWWKTALGLIALAVVAGVIAKTPDPDRPRPGH
ncbi:YihY/virulence factor BrkB family protein [Paucibacter sp. R3-3]|uniref:YihY/virulence factor BrkB family protein n=1 Tax=Roseateles agri TaxID=3098619 RepID=A0ABU5DMR0_9BURK|nr:YihY/virulence factor BrkB family protein [Paucibacter sp. R3-3]MDY0747568.1 YihY/virulence factor BrkB family protein [Paucibacter sp. R3-3]